METEIEIAPAMIEAGAEEFLRWSGGAAMDIGNEEVAVEAIFKAMIFAARLSPGPQRAG
jgi:hypothetical protein